MTLLARSPYELVPAVVGSPSIYGVPAAIAATGYATFLAIDVWIDVWAE